MGASSHPQLHRSAPPSASLSSTLNNFSQRFGSQLRKHSQIAGKRRKKGRGVTGVPQSFYVAVVCVFFAFPVIFVVYILARHAVFGDETETFVGKVHIHEVPPAFSTEPEQAGGIGEGQQQQPPSIEGVNNLTMIGEAHPSASASTDLQGEMRHVPDETNLNETVRDISDENGVIIEMAIDRRSSANIHNITAGEGENILALKEKYSGNDFERDTQTFEPSAKVPGSSHLLSTSARQEDVSSVSSLDKLGRNAGSVEKGAYQESLRGSEEKDD